MTEMTPPYWVIRYVESGESVPGGPFTVFIAENDDEDGHYFDLQCMPDEPSAQNIKLELDSYCIVSENGGVHYGGLKEVTLQPDRLVLQFLDDAVEELDLPSGVVELGIAPGIDIDEIRSGLRRVLSYGNPGKIPRMNF
ncbi:Imm10 family immunity protein [Streptomyces kebangsaanensis]|uniref:Imm10 family immunity protein n=1 Tax=Streptomyces kebangsaanensis TaxID=864058 RepID=UPI00093F1DF2|nr:Imm10 family immunity protein [Streptomyces kebangsaanensis]